MMDLSNSVIHKGLKALGYEGKIPNVEFQEAVWNTSFTIFQHDARAQVVRFAEVRIPRDEQILLVGEDWMLIRQVKNLIPRFDIMHANFHTHEITWICPLQDLIELPGDNRGYKIHNRIK